MAKCQKQVAKDRPQSLGARLTPRVVRSTHSDFELDLELGRESMVIFEVTSALHLKSFWSKKSQLELKIRLPNLQNNV